jgi:transposase
MDQAPLSKFLIPPKGGDYQMKNLDVLTTLFVGIDISSKTNVAYAMNFNQDKLLDVTVSNNHSGAVKLAEQVCTVMEGSEFERVVFAMESTSFYGVHIANFLSSDVRMLEHHPYVYCLNPKLIANYRKSFVGIDKTDDKDAFIISDFARVGRITTQPWRGSQYLALQRLTRHRLHLVECLVREKQYMVANIFLKFSELATLKKAAHPFCGNYGATAEAVLTEFYSPEQIIEMPLDELVAFLMEKGHSHFTAPISTAEMLQKAARESYRLDKVLYEPLNTAIASSFNCIEAFEKEIKVIDKKIELLARGLNENEYLCLKSIPGIGPVFASGILAEIGSISAFHSQDAVAKYAGLVWRRNQSGDFEADDTPLSKAGNRYLRYYLVEAAGSVIRFEPEYRDFYLKKFAEVKTHQHKRALALTARKLVRLIYGLLAKDQLYSPNRVGETS